MLERIQLAPRADDLVGEVLFLRRGDPDVLLCEFDVVLRFGGAVGQLLYEAG